MYNGQVSLPFSPGLVYVCVYRQSDAFMSQMKEGMEFQWSRQVADVPS